MSDSLTDPQPLRLNCPGCGEEVDVPPESAGQLVRCPYCNTDFFASVEESHLPVVDDTASEATAHDRAAAFDKLRIENYTSLRMGAIRSRSWWLIALCMSLLVALDMVGRAVIYIWVFRRWGWWPTVDLVIAILVWAFARHSWQRASEFKREIDRSAIPEPENPPDFSTLGDGSDRWKDLENVR